MPKYAPKYAKYGHQICIFWRARYGQAGCPWFSCNDSFLSQYSVKISDEEFENYKKIFIMFDKVFCIYAIYSNIVCCNMWERDAICCNIVTVIYADKVFLMRPQFCFAANFCVIKQFEDVLGSHLNLLPLKIPQLKSFPKPGRRWNRVNQRTGCGHEITWWDVILCLFLKSSCRCRVYSRLYTTLILHDAKIISCRSLSGFRLSQERILTLKN